MSEEVEKISGETPSGSEMEVVVASGGDDETSQVELPDTLPVLPLKNTVLFPYLLSPLLVQSAQQRAKHGNLF